MLFIIRHAFTSLKSVPLRSTLRSKPNFLLHNKAPRGSPTNNQGAAKNIFTLLSRGIKDAGPPFYAIGNVVWTVSFFRTKVHFPHKLKYIHMQQFSKISGTLKECVFSNTVSISGHISKTPIVKLVSIGVFDHGFRSWVRKRLISFRPVLFYQLYSFIIKIS